MLRLRRPTVDELARLAAEHRADGFTYDAVGATLAGTTPSGYHHAATSTRLGSGDEVFGRARAALSAWTPQRGSGLVVAADGPVAEGVVVALAAPLPVAGHAVAMCRVVGVVDEPRRYGFAYGTMPIHPEEGEELFMVEQSGEGEVEFRIRVFSRPHELLARIGSPIARRLQARATERYVEAMERAARVG